MNCLIKGVFIVETYVRNQSYKSVVINSEVCFLVFHYTSKSTVY